MKKLMLALSSVIAAACATPAAAQIGGEVYGARAEGVWGAELGLGYNIRVGPVSIRPSGGVLVFKGDNDRYYLDNNGGNPRCRDSTNGQYADSWRCSDVDAKPYARLEGLVHPTNDFAIGGGVRIRDDVQPYGTIAFRAGPKIQIKGNVGDDYYAAGLTFGF